MPFKFEEVEPEIIGFVENGRVRLGGSFSAGIRAGIERAAQVLQPVERFRKKFVEPIFPKPASREEALRMGLLSVGGETYIDISGAVTPLRQVGKTVAQPIFKGFKDLTTKILAREARKFKSAEEFIEAQPRFFHGTSKERAQRLIAGEAPKLSLPQGAEEIFGGKLKVFSLTPDKSIAEGFAELSEAGIKRKGDVVELFIDPNAKIVPLREIIGKNDVQRFIKENKIDAFREGDEISIVNPAVVKTKSQLIDFYNQAVKGVGKRPQPI